MSANALPFVDLFAKDLERVPASAELRQQEDAARGKLNEALEYEASGRTKKALTGHRSVVRKYPLTTAAAMSQFKIGELNQRQGNYNDAFDGFQDFIDNYKGSSAFPQAIRAQYEIAQAGQNGDYKSKVLGFIPRTVQNSELLEWYGKIIENAPFSDFAPLAQFDIGLIYEDDDDDARAIAAYQALVDKYPKHPKASEAQFRIGAIGKASVESGNQNIASLASARGAMEDVLVAYQDSAEAQEARAAIQQFDMVEAEKMFKIGKFYEKQKKFRSAAIYYKKVAAVTASPLAGEAQERLDTLLASAPEAGEDPPAPTPTPALPIAAAAGSGDGAASGGSGAVAADARSKPLLKARSDYVGPPAPDLKIVSTKPEMRRGTTIEPIEDVELDPEPVLPPPPVPEEEPTAEVAVTLEPEEEGTEETELPPTPPAPEDDDFLKLPPPPEPE